MFGSSQKKKGFYLDDDDTETSMYFNPPSVSSFRSDRDLLGSSSPSSQLSSFGNAVGSLYQQQQQSLQRSFAQSGAFQQRTTPTSGLGQPSLLTLQQQQQSPSRSILGNLAQRGPGGGGAAGGYHGQASQSFPALVKRGQAAPGGPMGLHSTFYPPPRNQGDLQLPGHSNFDLSHSEFPSLGNRGGGGAGGGALTMQASMRGYAADMNGTGQAKFPQIGDAYRYGAAWPRGSGGSGKGAVGDPANEFSIQQEDFPALPGTQSSLPSASAGGTGEASSKSGANETSSKGGASGSAPSGGGGSAASREPSAVIAAAAASASSGGMPAASSVIAAIGSGAPTKDQKSQQQQQKKGIQNLPDGTVTNIPAGMVTDQFGMVGLLTFIRAAETDPQLVALAPGIDLTTLGLNLNLSESLYSTFQSPWADMPCRPQDIDFTVPAEYLTNVTIREKLSPIKLSRYGDDLLFFLFYTNPGDALQLLAAAELYNRDWRYHKDEQVWITRANTEPVMKNNSCERGTYIFFDVQNWRKVPKECVLEYSKLEERPLLPASYVPGQVPGLMGH